MARLPKVDPVVGEIGRRVEFLRQSKRLTREQLAHAGEVSKSIVTRVEQAVPSSSTPIAATASIAIVSPVRE